MMQELKKNSFLFQQLVSRDFKQKYKRTALGMLWSILSPLLTLFIMRIVFLQFFGRNTPHYTTYLFSGIIVMSFYKEATKAGMSCLVDNSAVITKINLPKYLFVCSRNVSALVNFFLTFGVYLIFCVIDYIQFHVGFFALIYPMVTLTLMNVGIGMILSCMYIFFRDTTYLYDVFLTLLNYLSAIFYTVEQFPQKMQRLFLMNPVYAHIKYFRLIVIENSVPSPAFHGLLLFYALFFLTIGFLMYKRYNHEFIYYL